MAKLQSKCRKCGTVIKVDRSNMKKPTDDPRVMHLREELGDETIVRLGDHFETTRIGAKAPKAKNAVAQPQGKQLEKKGNRTVVVPAP